MKTTSKAWKNLLATIGKMQDKEERDAVFKALNEFLVEDMVNGSIRFERALEALKV